MPDSPTANMALILPTQDSLADANDWDRLLNIALGTVIDQHDHTAGKGVRIPSAGLNINATVEFNGYRATELTGLAMQNLGSVLGSGSLEFFTYSGNAYFRNGSGQNVRITSGATLDVSSVGGIAGDYASIGAEFAYVDASDTYTAKQELDTAVRQWARGAFGGIDLYEYLAAGDVTPITNRVRLASPAALASSYALTFPAALPGSDSLIQVTSAGVLTFTRALSVDTLATSGAATVGSTLGVTGLITATAGVTAAANQHVTVSGTGAFKHGTRKLGVHGSAFQTHDGSPAYANTGLWNLSAGSDSVDAPIPLHEGDRISSIGITFVSDGAGVLTIQLKKDTALATAQNVGSVSADLDTLPAGTYRLTFTPDTAPYTIGTSEVYYCTIAGTGDVKVANISIEYDRP